MISFLYCITLLTYKHVKKSLQILSKIFLLLLIFFFLGEVKLFIFININFILRFIIYVLDSEELIYDSWYSFILNIINNHYKKDLLEYMDHIINKRELNENKNSIYYYIISSQTYSRFFNKFLLLFYYSILLIYIWFFLKSIIIIIKYMILLLTKYTIYDFINFIRLYWLNTLYYIFKYKWYLIYILYSLILFFLYNK